MVSMVWKGRIIPLTKRRNVPKEKNDEPIIGMIQEMLARELQPNQKRQIGIKKDPTIAGISRFSGLISPASLNCCSWT